MEGYDGNAPLLATMDPAALVLRPAVLEIAQLGATRGHSLTRFNPRDTSESIHVERVSVATNGEAMAVQFEHAIETSDGIDTTAFTTPVTELLVDDRVQAFAAGLVHEPGASPGQSVPRTTEPGPLTALLVAPERAAAALRDDPGVGVITTRERAIGPAAKALLASDPPMKIHDKPYEVHHRSWRFVQAHLDREIGDKTYRLSGQLIAFLEDGKWSVVSVHYLALL